MASATPRSSRMSPPANSVHAEAGSYVGTPGAGPSSVATSGQPAREPTRPSPNSDLPPQATARTDGPTSSARRNPMRAGWPARFVASACAVGTVTRRSPRDARSRRSAARIPSASRSTRTSDANGELPDASAAMSAGLVLVRADRNGTTGVIARSASGCGPEGVGAADGEGDSPPLPAGLGVGDAPPAGAELAGWDAVGGAVDAEARAVRGDVDGDAPNSEPDARPTNVTRASAATATRIAGTTQGRSGGRGPDDPPPGWAPLRGCELRGSKPGSRTVTARAYSEG